MNILSKLALVAITAGACAVAGAQTTYSSDADRRAANREEALQKHRAGVRNDSRADTRYGRRDDSLRAKTHRVAQGTRNFTHRQLEKSRAFKARQDARAPRSGAVESVHNPAAMGK